MSCFGYSTKFLDLDGSPIVKENGLVISNGAISEMRGKLLDDYIEHVVSRARYGYFITNFETYLPYGGPTTAQFMDSLRDVGKADVVELSSSKYLSYFDHQGGDRRNRLIVFGAKVPKSTFETRFSDKVKIRLLQKLFRLNDRLIKYVIV